MNLNSIQLKLTSLATPLVVAAFSATAALAQEGAKKAPSKSLGEVLGDSGAVGLCIVLLSVVALAVIIENFVSLNRDKLAPPELIDEIQALFEDEQYQEAMELCENEPNYFTRVCGAGIAKIGHSFPVVEKAMEEMGDEESIKLHQKVGWLALIANVAPMMGLLGTVGGMVEAFNEIAASSGGANPAQLASGISKALLTTMFGLIVALPVTASFAFIRNRMVRNIIEVGAIVEDLFEHFRDEAN
ncbi:MAG: MotA/TolQ/ExbB proton channel family protein [Planctomycetota bacterium]|jgi:biopolymer transport protein ExbB|nr:MotA/TolQ/ExbB proton channel family protein [Planctomycetota bacterium]MDP6741275.1 MotA/TolQ/ExbB proton channel family protein [Planctomycetota bacterium]MDP6937586.1 MotA/TolQ/ExbB proton channel family protein [Planctomycetota bacterium]